MLARVRAILPQVDNFVTEVQALAQTASHALGGFLTQAGDEKLLGVRERIKPTKLEKA